MFQLSTLTENHNDQNVNDSSPPLSVPCQAPPIRTNRITEILSRVKTVFNFVDSFIPKQRITEIKMFYNATTPG